MATDFSRMRMKRSTIPGTVPTIPPVLDINTFLNTDIFPGELFYNMPDNKLYTSDGTNINLIVTGSGPGGAPTLGQVLLNGNTSDGTDIILDSSSSLLSGTGEILNLLSDTGVFAQANDTVYNQILDMLPVGGTINLANQDIASGGYNSLLLNSFNKEIFLTSFDPINATANITLNSSATPATDFSLSLPTGLTNRLQFDGTQIQLVRSDGVNFNNRLEVLDADMLFEAEDLINNRQANLELRHNFTYFSHFNNGLLSYIQAQDDTIDLQTQDGNFLQQISLDPALINIQTTELATANTTIVELNTDYVNLSHGDGVSGDTSNVEVGYDVSISTPYVKSEISNALTLDLNKLEINNNGLDLEASTAVVGVYGRTFITNSAITHTVEDASIATINTITVDNSQIELRSDDTTLVTTSTIQLTPTSINYNAANHNMVGLTAFADDAAAGVGGLVAGDLYQTDGSGAAPLNAAGILMVKQ